MARYLARWRSRPRARAAGAFALTGIIAILLCGPRAFAQSSSTEEPPAVELSGAPGKGFTAAFGDDFSVNLRMRMQPRYQLDLTADEAFGHDAAQTVNIGTARLWLSGHAITSQLGYMLQLAVAARDYREGATSPIYDAFIDWKVHRDASLRVGQYFVPFDRLRTVREWALQMADRPRPVNELTLDRDVGITLYSDRFLGEGSPLAYRVGVFGGGGIHRVGSKEPGALFVARVELRPLGAIDDDVEGDLERLHAPRLALGTAVALNLSTDRSRSTTGTIYAGGTTDYAHAATDLVFKWYGAALQLQYVLRHASEDTIESFDEEGVPRIEATRSGHGWIAQASYIFPVPIEIVGRMSRMIARKGTDGRFVVETTQHGQELAVGLNYYVLGHRFKLQADWIARAPTDFDLGAADHVVHMQVDATF